MSVKSLATKVLAIHALSCKLRAASAERNKSRPHVEVKEQSVTKFAGNYLTAVNIIAKESVMRGTVGLAQEILRG